MDLHGPAPGESRSPSSLLSSTSSLPLSQPLRTRVDATWRPAVLPPPPLLPLHLDPSPVEDLLPDTLCLATSSLVAPPFCQMPEAEYKTFAWMNWAAPACDAAGVLRCNYGMLGLCTCHHRPPLVHSAGLWSLLTS